MFPLSLSLSLSVPLFTIVRYNNAQFMPGNRLHLLYPPHPQHTHKLTTSRLSTSPCVIQLACTYTIASSQSVAFITDVRCFCAQHRSSSAEGYHTILNVEVRTLDKGYIMFGGRGSEKCGLYM